MIGPPGGRAAGRRPPARRAAHRTTLLRPPGPPTPIWISPRTRAWLVAAAGAALVLFVYLAPGVLTLALGGVALALVLSFPVRLLTRVVPKEVAIALSCLLVAGLLVLLVAIVVPILFEQLAALVASAPGIAERLGARLPPVLDQLARRELLPDTPERFLEQLKHDTLLAVETFIRRLLGGAGHFVSGAVNIVVTLFGIVFLAVYFLADARQIEATTLRAAPRRYRHDVRDLWNAFSHTLSRYLGGLALAITIEGALTALSLAVLGVPYALLLGVWVTIAALVPYLGAWIGAIPAVLLALTISRTTAVLTVLLYVVIQQLDANVLTPRIQGRAVRVHPILIFLAVIAGGELFGIPGVLVAVPIVAVLRVLFDFFRARLRTVSEPDAVRQVRA